MDVWKGSVVTFKYVVVNRVYVRGTIDRNLIVVFAH